MPQEQGIDMQELAGQLRCPRGETGIMVGAMMNLANGNAISKTIKSLALQDSARVLEIGPGNGLHVEDVLSSGSEVTYHGIDISPTMTEEASKNNEASKNCCFQLYDGHNIPFKDSTFDAVFTVNTIYFWENPGAYAAEIARVMKPGAQVSVCFVPEHNMKLMPFTKFAFTLYAADEVLSLFGGAGLHHRETILETEEVPGINGTVTERQFNILIFKK